MADGASLLIVEDDDVLRSRLAAAFVARGFSVRKAASVAEAEQLATDDPPELVVLDLRVGHDNGLTLIPVLLGIDPETRIVILTGYGSIATALEAVKRGATHYLTKPADADEILAAFSKGTGDPAAPAPAESMSLDRVEWEYINRVLMDCDNNISEAARLLGMHRRTLQRKLNKFPTNR